MKKPLAPARGGRTGSDAQGADPPPAAGARLGGRSPGAGIEKLDHVELVALCLYRREDAWREFLRRFSRLIYSVILRYRLPDGDRDDAFQATIEAAFRQLHTLNDPEKLVSWLIGIASRQSINQIRRLRRETQVGDVSEEMLLDGPSPSTPPGLPDEEVLLMERAQQAREGLEALPERCRRVLRSLFFEDPAPDYRELARREGIPVGNIGSLRVRCIERLRRVFDARGWLDA